MSQDLTEHELKIADQVNVIGNAVFIVITNMVWLVAYILLCIIAYLVTTDIIDTLHIVVMLLLLLIGLNATVLRNRWVTISRVVS